MLLVGGGVAGNLREILKHPVEAVTYVELDPLLIEAAQAICRRRTLPCCATRASGSSRPMGDDMSTTTEERFDVVILDLPEPITGALNRYYTSEFFGGGAAES